MNSQTIFIIACAAVLLASLGKVRQKSEGSNNPDILLNAHTLTFVGCAILLILFALAALSTI